MWALMDGQAEMTGREDEANLCTGPREGLPSTLRYVTAHFVQWPVSGGSFTCLRMVERVRRVFRPAGHLGVFKKRPEQTERVEEIGVRSQKGRCCVGPWKYWGDTCKGCMEVMIEMKRWSGEVKLVVAGMR
jgi:hypothetical protein